MKASDMLDDYAYPRFTARFRDLRQAGFSRYFALAHAFFADGCGGAAASYDWLSIREAGSNALRAGNECNGVAK